ncbi:zinc ribbon domain-containing protein, partial [Limnoraphis robusta]
SSCGHVQEMPLKERVFNCNNCGVSVDRDLNASLNLEGYAEGFLVKSLSDRVLPTVRGEAPNETLIRFIPCYISFR